MKADNKVIITHLDKLIKEKNENKEKTAREIFEEREKRVIDSLYSKTIGVASTEHSSQTSTNKTLLPS